jgi:hypothetical protein
MLFVAQALEPSRPYRFMARLSMTSPWPTLSDLAIQNDRSLDDGELYELNDERHRPLSVEHLADFGVSFQPDRDPGDG